VKNYSPLCVLLHLLPAILLLFVCTAQVHAQEDAQLNLGEEYSEHSKPAGSAKASGKNRSLLVSGLLYIPNRVLDILDIFRVDVGVGPAVGAVARVTKYGQVGARLMMPVSARVGLRGRKIPVFIEHTSEMGVGPLYLDSPQREATPLEVGAGVDLILVGAYVGISVDSIFDALTGFVGFDISEDDL
jgi:hypothetical protein